MCHGAKTIDQAVLDEWSRDPDYAIYASDRFRPSYIGRVSLEDYNEIKRQVGLKECEDRIYDEIPHRAHLLVTGRGHHPNETRSKKARVEPSLTEAYKVIGISVEDIPSIDDLTTPDKLAAITKKIKKAYKGALLRTDTDRGGDRKDLDAVKSAIKEIGDSHPKLKEMLPSNHFGA